MDLSIRIITPELWQDRGVQAYDDGLDADDHGLDHDSPARKHWQYGWHMRRVELQQLAEAREAA